MAYRANEQGVDAARRTSRPIGLPERARPRRELRGAVFLVPALLFLLAFGLVPLVRAVQLSFMDVAAGEWSFVGLQHYRDAVSDRWFWNSVRATVAFTLPAVALHLTIGVGLALLLNQPWPGKSLRNVVRGLLILPWVFSTAASAIMWILLLHPTGQVNYALISLFGDAAQVSFLSESPTTAMASLVAVNTWLLYPFIMIAALGRLQSIPRELIESATVDGAGALKRFRHVTLPQLRSTLVAVLAIDFIFTFGQIDLMLLMTRGGPLRQTETTGLYMYKSGLLDGDLGYGAAVSTVMLITVMLIIAMYLRLASRGGLAGDNADAIV